MMSETKQILHEVAGEVHQLAGFHAKLFLLTLSEKLSEAGGAFLWQLARMMFISMAFLFFGIGLAALLGTWLNGIHWGFLIVSGFFVLGYFVLKLFRKQIFQRPMLQEMMEIVENLNEQ